MKTSNKILIGLFALILISIGVLLIALRHELNVFGVAENEYSGKSTEQQISMPKFTKIDVEGKFQLHYTQDTFQKIVIKADSNLIHLAVLEVTDGRLMIHSKKVLREYQRIDVFITNDSINELKSSAGTIFKTLNKMKVQHFHCEGSAGSVFKLEGDFKDLDIKFFAGCVADLSGSCHNLGMESSAGCVVKASNLVAIIGNISASAGSVISILVTGELNVHANAGSIVKYQGNPKLNNINVTSGAQLNHS